MDDLLRAVIEAPDDDAPRLVYADALMRAGDPRGDFIALQLANKPEADALLAEHKATWLAALPNVIDAHFERGFATAASIRCDRARPALASLDREPIVTLSLVPDDDVDLDPLAVAAWFAADPRTSRIRSLDLTKIRWQRDPFATLLAADLRGLRELHIGDDDCETYACAELATREGLTTLGFHGDANAELDEGIALLAASPRMASLETLLLSDCGLTASAGLAIGASPHFANLRHLSFSGGSYQANRLRDDGALGLLAMPALARLSLVHNQVTDRFIEALAAPTALPALTNLAANGCKGVTSRGIVAFASSPRFAAMQELWLGGCQIDDAGVAAIAQYGRALRALNLHGNPIGADGARALADSPLAASLERLSIAITPELEAILRPAFGDRLNRAR